MMEAERTQPAASMFHVWSWKHIWHLIFCILTSLSLQTSGLGSPVNEKHYTTIINDKTDGKTRRTVRNLNLYRTNLQWQKHCSLLRQCTRDYSTTLYNYLEMLHLQLQIPSEYIGIFKVRHMTVTLFVHCYMVATMMRYRHGMEQHNKWRKQCVGVGGITIEAKMSQIHQFVPV